MYGIKLKNFRESKNITQYKVAQYLRLHEGRYSQYETECDIIPLKHLIKVCDYFNFSLDYIFDFTDKIKYKTIQNQIDPKIVGNRLKELRKELDLTQENLAQFLNTTKSVISGYEIGRRLISTSFLYAICKKYNISADYLLGKIDNPKYLK